MEDIKIMKLLKSKRNLNQGLPNGLFIEMSLLFLVLHDFLVEISIIRKFHNNTESYEHYHKELDSIKACL